MRSEYIYGGGAIGAGVYQEAVELAKELGRPIPTRAEWLDSLKGVPGLDFDDAQPLWDAERLYQPRAAVTEAGSFYRARRATRGERPAETPDAWAVVVQGVDLGFADQVKAEVEQLGGQQISAAASHANSSAAQASAALSARAAADAARQAAEAAAANAQASALAVSSWNVLSAITGMAPGTGAEVLDGDAGTHTDPVAGGTVPNAGRYSWSASPAGWRRIGDTGLSIKADRTEVTAATTEAVFRAALWRFTGDYSEGVEVPLVVTEAGLVVVGQGGRDAELEFRRSMWRFTGSYAVGVDVPVVVSDDGLVIQSGTWPPSGGGGAAASNVIDLNAAYGQSNAELQAGLSASLVYGATPVDGILTLLRGSAADIWLGQATAGGASVELKADTITGMGEAVPQIAASGSHGSGSIDGFARRWRSRKGRRVLTWTLAEGGQSISNLLDSAGEGYWGAKNITTALTKAMELKPAGSEIVWRWMLMHQGESNRSTSTLGVLHEQARAECEAKAQRILGQAEPLRMTTWQFSSTPAGSSTEGVRSLLDYAIAHDAGPARVKTFFCAGPTYGFPWSSDYLHHTSVGHAMRGEADEAIARRVEDEGYFLPLHAVAAAVTGVREITVTLSEPAVVTVDDRVKAVADLGVSVTGATIEAVTVAGTSVVISTSDAASGATSVGFAEQRHAEPREAATIPRTNIRAVRPLGAYGDALRAQGSGDTIHNWMCHQIITIS